MPLLQIIVLAVVQGFTEFLPISSTAHLYLTSWLLGWHPESLSFDITLHIGTLLAVLIYFGRDWVQIIAQGFGLSWGRSPELKHNRGLLWLLALSTVPAGVAGLLLNKYAETAWRNPLLMGVMLVVVGAVMWYAERAGKMQRELGSVNAADAVVIGAAQALAIVPGCSRSGITISAGLFRGLDRAAAARFSFLLSTPVIAAAALKALWDLHKQHLLAGMLNAQFGIGVAVSALTGCAVIAWFLHYLRRNGLAFFIYYRIVFGIIVIVLAFIRPPA
jgi:undecaprenyl-diphosphatase